MKSYNHIYQYFYNVLKIFTPFRKKNNGKKNNKKHFDVPTSSFIFIENVFYYSKYTLVMYQVDLDHQA